MSFEGPPQPENTGESMRHKQDVPEAGERKEREPGFDLDFYVTDHSADNADTGNPEKLKELYEDIKKDGIQSMRYDWRWGNIEPKAGSYSEEHLERYAQAKEVMEEAGLEAPTIILSSVPGWAVELYKKDKEKFFGAYKSYAERVAGSLEKTEGAKKVERVQILNELNSPVFTPIAAEDVPRLCEITREAFRGYNADIKLVASLSVGNVGETAAKAGIGTPIKEYLRKMEEMKDGFDVVALDYYPGLWHLDAEGPSEKNPKGFLPKEIFKQMAKNTEFLKEIFEEVAASGKEYELGEVGSPSKLPWGGEKSQRYFYDAFFRAFKQLLVDLRSRGVKLPSRVGMYEAIDEPPKNVVAKILSKTPWPEHNLGMRRADGERKMILQGNRHVPEGEENNTPAQLRKIIDYLRAPMEKAEKEE